jgi:heptosyltransferase-2
MDLLQKPKRRFLLLGGPGEKPLAERIIASTAHPPINMVGKTTIAEALVLISRCGLFLSNDSGLMHAAAALGIPQVALFGSTDPGKTAPLNDKAVVIHPEGVSCSPCFKSECQENLDCMKAITVDEVYAAAEKLLSSEPQRPQRSRSSY